MKFVDKNGIEIECSPAEFVELKKLEQLDIIKPISKIDTSLSFNMSDEKSRDFFSGLLSVILIGFRLLCLF